MDLHDGLERHPVGPFSRLVRAPCLTGVHSVLNLKKKNCQMRKQAGMNT